LKTPEKIESKPAFFTTAVFYDVQNDRLIGFG